MILDLLVQSALHSILLGLATWLLLKILFVRRASVRMIVWTIVLFVSAAMPGLLPCMKISVRISDPTKNSIQAVAAPPIQTDAGIDVAQLSAFHSTDFMQFRPTGGEWRVWATAIYLTGTSVMLIPIFLGLMLTHRLARAALPLRDHWTGALKIRVSKAVKSPATFGSTILLPADHPAWSTEKRRAVLLHEGSHVANCDFYVLLLASFYRAVFWFNPFAWWLSANLSDLAEIVADDAAAKGLGSQLRYAEILTNLVRSPDRLPAGLAMARRDTMAWRIRRLHTMDLMPNALGQRQRMALGTAFIPFALLSAATLNRTVEPPTAFVSKGTEQTNAARPNSYAGRRLLQSASCVRHPCPAGRARSVRSC